MKLTFISLFDNFIETFKDHSIIKNALKKELLEIEWVNPRDFSVNGRVDDNVYGGGRGMLLLLEPLVNLIKTIKTEDSILIYLSPRGQIYNQKIAKNFSNKKHLIFLSGNYEGIDSRIRNFIDYEISIGEFILTNGELPSLILADSIIRLIPGVIKEESFKDESFENNLLEYDHFTKPANFLDLKVPEVLLSGDHKKIKDWRRKNSISNTIDYIWKKN